jgi:hypothetical protein
MRQSRAPTVSISHSTTAFPYTLSHAILQLLTILSRPRSSKTLLHLHPAQKLEDSSEEAVSVSTSIYDVDDAETWMNFYTSDRQIEERVRRADMGEDGLAVPN